MVRYLRIVACHCRLYSFIRSRAYGIFTSIAVAILL